MAKKKSELVEEAEAAGVEVDDHATKAEIEEALEEAAAAPTEANVKVENRDGAITLVFGSHVPDEEEAGFDEQSSFVISRDDAVQLAADLPVVAQDAMATAVHTG